jgi:sialidase-1
MPGKISAALVDPHPGPSAPFAQAPLFVNGVGGYAIYRIPALASHACGEGGRALCLYAFAEARVSHSDAGHIDLVFRRSENGGHSWLPAERVFAWGDGATTVGNPAPVWVEGTETSAGKLLLLFTVNNTWPFVMSRPLNGEWSRPRNLSQVLAPGAGWFATGPGHAIQLRGVAQPNATHVRAHHVAASYKGRLVVPVDHALGDADVTIELKLRTPAGGDGRSARVASMSYRVVNANANAEGAEAYAGALELSSLELPEYAMLGGRAAALLSDDGGATWRLGGVVPKLGSNEASIAELEDGALLCSFRVEVPETAADRGCRHFALSLDGGESWGRPFIPGGEQCAVRDPRCEGSVLFVAGVGLLASAPSSATSRTGMALHRARDADGVRGLAGWSKAAQLTSGSAMYSDLVLLGTPPVARSGRVGGRATLATVGVLYEANWAGVGLIAFARVPIFDS